MRSVSLRDHHHISSSTFLFIYTGLTFFASANEMSYDVISPVQRILDEISRFIVFIHVFAYVSVYEKKNFNFSSL